MPRGSTLRDSRGRYAGSTRGGRTAYTPKSVRAAQHAAWTAQAWLRAYKRHKRKVAAQKRQPAPPQVPISTEWIRPVVPQRPPTLSTPVPTARSADTHSHPRTVTVAAAQTVTVHGQEYVFTTEGGQDAATCGIIGSLWRHFEDEGDGASREWMAYVREGGIHGRYLMGGVPYNWEDAETELAPLNTLVV